MRPTFGTLLRLMPVVIGTSLASVGLLWLFRQWVTVEELRPSNNEVGNYLQAVGTVYAVLLAFVVQSVWSQFNEARTHVEQEATDVVDLYRTTDGLPDDERIQVQAAIRNYAEAVIAREWQAMARHTNEDVIEEVGAELDPVWAALHDFEPASNCHQALHAEALSRFNDLSDARTNRLASARTRMPFGLKLLLYIGAVIVVISMFLVAIDSFAIHAIITGALAGAVSHILYLVQDLDDSFSGIYMVSTAPFERALRQIRRGRPA